MTTTEFQAEFLSRSTMPAPDDAQAIISQYVVRRGVPVRQTEQLGRKPRVTA